MHAQVFRKSAPHESSREHSYRHPFLGARRRLDWWIASSSVYSLIS
jgi:hypothetical protein